MEFGLMIRVRTLNSSIRRRPGTTPLYTLAFLKVGKTKTITAPSLFKITSIGE